LLPPTLLRRTGVGVTVGLVGYLALFGLLFATPFYCQDVLHLSPARTGLLLTALPAAIGLTAPLAGGVADRHPHWPLVPAGLATVSLAMLLCAIVSPGQLALAALLAMAGGGFGIFNPANNAAVMGSAPAAGPGQLGGLLNMTRGLGTALGVAVTGLVLAGSAEPGHGFRTAGWLLAALTAATALVALRPHRTPTPDG
jgi:MFS family permease